MTELRSERQPMKTKMHVVFEGEEREVVVGQGRTKVRPVVVTRSTSYDMSESGVGFKSEETGEVYAWWTLIQPVNLIHLYRAMKVLESLDHIGTRGSDLSDAYYTAQRRIDSMAEPLGSAPSMSSRIGENRRKEILEMIPPNLEPTILDLKEKGIPVDGWDIKEAVDAGVLKSTPVIEGVIEESERISEEARKRLGMNKE